MTSLSEVHSNCRTSESTLKFSKICSETALRIDFKDGLIQTSIEVFRRNQWINILNPDVLNCDYVVIDDVVSPIQLDPLLDMAVSIEFNLFSSISMSQYARIMGVCYNNESVILHDCAKEQLDQHPVKQSSYDLLDAELYSYQEVGVGWLNFIAGIHGGCILGDEMGLGKTLQIIALVVGRLQVQDKSSLIVAPASLLENWKREFDRFTHDVDVFIHHGPDRTGNYMDLRIHQVIITSYNIVVSDFSLFSMISWDLLVLDEAQNIKNRDSIRSRTVKSIGRCTSIAVTGTPFENHMSDVWSIMDFVLPGYLGSSSTFERNYADSHESAVRLEPLITPVMLRRRVSEAADDLPPRVDVPIVVSMGDSEASGYEELRQEILSKHNTDEITGFMIQKLRMFCTHPDLVYPDASYESAKFDLFKDLVSELCELGEKTIVFTSFNRMFGIIEDYVTGMLHVPVFIINGSVEVSIRQPIVDSFTGIDGPAVMILNPRAAGVGLNITAASRVIHYSLEWNPALEDQASARAYRRGQTRTVFVYRLYYKDTAEEVINARIERKRDLFDTVIIGTDGTSSDREDLMRAISMSPRK